MGLPKTTKTLQTPKQNTFQVSIPLTESRETFNETGFSQGGNISKASKQSRLSKVSNSERLADLANLSEKAKYASYYNLKRYIFGIFHYISDFKYLLYEMDSSSPLFYNFYFSLWTFELGAFTISIGYWR